jgi:hypothetical protein
MDFPEYALKYSKQAMESKKNIERELLPTVDDILDKLAHDPLTSRREIIPASVTGKTFIYRNSLPEIQITYEVDPEKKIIYLFDFVAPRLPVKNSLFISYSHQDSEWLDRLRQNLSVLEQQGLIDVWDDGELKPGEKWAPQIEQALARCVGAVLLVSPDFLASSFITGVELPSLLSAAERGDKKKIFWIHVRRSNVFENEKFKEIIAYQSLLDDPRKPLADYNDMEKKKAFDKIAQEIRAAVLH